MAVDELSTVFVGRTVYAVNWRYPEYQRAETALIEEKAKKLFGLTRLLDSFVKDDFESILRSRPHDGNSTSQKVRILNGALAEFTDRVASCFPGVGLGYYSKDLRAILCYSPSREFGSKVGIDLGRDHIGWQAMETGKETMGVGSMIRGEIMNCMRPLIRNGKAIGFVWANETLADIYAQLQAGAKHLFFSKGAEPLLGFTGLLLFASKMLVMDSCDQNSVRQISRDVARLDQYIRLFLNSLAAGILLSDSKGKVVFSSSGISDVLGISASDLMGSDIYAFLEGLGLEPEQVLGEPAVNRGDNRPEIKIRSAHRGKLLNLVSTTITGGDGSTWGHVVIIEDLEAVRAHEEFLARAERLATVGEIASSLAHEIRNPLTVIRGAAALVPDRLNDHDFLKRFSEIALSEMERVNRTVDSLMDFSRFSKPSLTLVDVEHLVRKASTMIAPYAKLNDVSVELSCSVPPTAIWGDPDHLMQALLNLLLNGVQAMPNGGSLTIVVEPEADSRYLKILVKDTGTGIAPENRSKVFDMFFTLKKDGTGLGLPLVQRIVFEHQGFVDFESEVGKGTTFCMHLPLFTGREEGLRSEV